MNHLIWFRKDLRIQDNPALCEAVKHGVSRAVFISTPAQWKRHDLAPIQVNFILRHLEQLRCQLKSYGISLIHLRANRYDDQLTTLASYCQCNEIDTVYVNQQLELKENVRDKQASRYDLNLVSFSSETIVPLGDIVNKQGDMFKVFTPFKKTWLAHVQHHGVKVEKQPDFLTSVHSDNDSVQETFDYPNVDSSHWPLSETVLNQVIPKFIQKKLHRYEQQRDYPALKGTSGLSPYLAIGAINSRYLANELIIHSPDVLDDQNHPHFSWLNELIWRDFYKHLLFHYPNLIRGDCFQTKYQQLNWPNNPAFFQAWCEGKTGYPLVDAAMRQLLHTGWMHNRLRMVVASFLTKHLLVDWRWGERFFMQHLIDGDFSANNGGWHWAAGTGCDAQPYFRIFNPITQSEKFDPQGEFIRKFLPELSDVPSKHIHFPHIYLEKTSQTEKYWPAIVEHKQARLDALGFYQVASF